MNKDLTCGGSQVMCEMILQLEHLSWETRCWRLTTALNKVLVEPDITGCFWETRNHKHNPYSSNDGSWFHQLVNYDWKSSTLQIALPDTKSSHVWSNDVQWVQASFGTNVWILLRCQKNRHSTLCPPSDERCLHEQNSNLQAGFPCCHTTFGPIGLFTELVSKSHQFPLVIS